MEDTLKTLNIYKNFKMCFFKKYATFKGRATRGEYWKFILTNAFILIVLNLVGRVLTNFTLVSNSLVLYFLRNFVVRMETIYRLISVVPIFAVGARRLHDVNLRGWFQLMPLALSFVTFIVVFLTIFETTGNSVIIATILVQILAGIWLFVKLLSKGTDGENHICLLCIYCCGNYIIQKRELSKTFF